MKVLKIAYYAVIILIMGWVAVSWMDIVADNCFSNPVHHPLNFFEMMFGGVA